MCYSLGITCDNPMNTLSDKQSHQFYCNAEIAIECAEGFRLVGLNKIRCMENGNWSNSMPVCEYIPPSMFHKFSTYTHAHARTHKENLWGLGLSSGIYVHYISSNFIVQTCEFEVRGKVI